MSSQSVLGRVYRMSELKACPIETTFRIVGKKWTVLILREMFLGVRQFNRLEGNIKGITPKVLSQRLRELRKHGIVERTIVSEAPIRVEYRLTEKGHGLEALLCSAAAFSMATLPDQVFKDGKPRSPREIFGRGTGNLMVP